MEPALQASVALYVKEIAFVKEWYGQSMQPMVWETLLAAEKDVAFLHVLPLPKSIASSSGKGPNHHVVSQASYIILITGCCATSTTSIACT